MIYIWTNAVFSAWRKSRVSCNLRKHGTSRTNAGKNMYFKLPVRTREWGNQC